MEETFAEVFKHGDGVDAGLGAGDGDVAVSVVVHRLQTAWLRHTVVDTNRRFFFLLLRQYAPANSSSCLGVTIRARVSVAGVRHDVLARFSVQCVAVLACQINTRS